MPRRNRRAPTPEPFRITGIGTPNPGAGNPCPPVAARPEGTAHFGVYGFPDFSTYDKLAADSGGSRW